MSRFAIMLGILAAAAGAPAAEAGATNQPQGRAAAGASMSLTNEKTRNHPFLKAMYDDKYFPRHLVDKGKQILIRLCARIEKEKPANVAALYELTHAATEEFNELAHEFEDEGSELETAARESIGEEFWFISQAYGFTQADAEELIATRDW